MTADIVNTTTDEIRDHFVYLLYDDGLLLYVGCTNDLARRRREHQRLREWWPQVTSWRVVGPYTAERALAVERATIRAARPLCNVLHMSDAGHLMHLRRGNARIFRERVTAAAAAASST